MKKLVLTVLVSGIFAGSLFANENHMMDMQNCMKMHKQMHKQIENKKSDSIHEQNLKMITPDIDESSYYEG